MDWFLLYARRLNIIFFFSLFLCLPLESTGSWDPFDLKFKTWISVQTFRSTRIKAAPILPSLFSFFKVYTLYSNDIYKHVKENHRLRRLHSVRLLSKQYVSMMQGRWLSSSWVSCVNAMSQGKSRKQLFPCVAWLFYFHCEPGDLLQTL